MGKDKIVITDAHALGIKKALGFFKNQSDMARYLGVYPSNISMWSIKMQLIPIHQAQKLSSNFDITLEELRPDLKTSKSKNK